MDRKELQRLAGINENVSMTDQEFEQLKSDIIETKKRLDELQKMYMSQTGQRFEPFR